MLKLKIDNGGDGESVFCKVMLPLRCSFSSPSPFCVFFEVQVRRIPVSDVWGKSTSCLSFGKMMSIASRFLDDTENKLDDAAFLAKARTSYYDEDGDEVTMTSDQELEDAFRQVLKKFPAHKPFIVMVTIPSDKPTKVAAAAGKAAPGVPKRIQLKKGDPRKKLMVSLLTDEPAKTTLRVTPQKFEKDFFIHARHTCDGCSKSPIIGARYHATKIPDFDLCGACFEKYEGEDLDFKPEIHGMMCTPLLVAMVPSGTSNIFCPHFFLCRS